MSTPSSNAFKTTIGGKTYFVSITLMNDQEDMVMLSRNALRLLEIEDNVFNPFHTGSIIITNDFNVIENSMMPYVFLGNGRDILNIHIELEGVPTENIPEYTINQQCVVIECNEVMYQNSLCKKIDFVDIKQYMLNEQYSSALSIKSSQSAVGVNSYLLLNAENSQTTGQLIKQIINEVYGNAANDFSLFEVDATGKPIFDEEGCLPINVTPYGNMSYGYFLQYVIQMHSHKGSPCILDYDRFTKKFKLISIKRLMEESTTRYNEVLKFPDPQQIDDKLPDSTKYNIDYLMVELPNPESSIMEFYTHAPAAKYGIDFYTSEAISSYSRSTGTFSYNLNSLNTEGFTKQYEELFVDPFKPLLSKYKLSPSFYTPSNAKFNNKKTIDVVGSLPVALTEKHFINIKMTSLLYMNHIYKFKLMGNTRRHSMSFVDVMKKSLKRGQEPSKWDYNTLGRHFVTSVKHIFTHDTYYNEIETVKPYRLSKSANVLTAIGDFLKL